MEPFIFHFSPDYGKKCNWQNAMQLSLASLLRIHFGVQGTAARRREKPDLCERGAQLWMGETQAACR